jgi:hypothetical protein
MRELEVTVQGIVPDDDPGRREGRTGIRTGTRARGSGRPARHHERCAAGVSPVRRRRGHRSASAESGLRKVAEPRRLKVLVVLLILVEILLALIKRH